MELSIIIVNHNAQECLSRCLESFYRNPPEIKLEVIIIDNNSQDKSIAILKDDFRGLRIIENKTNVGFAKAVNQGIRLAKGKYILCLNNDTIVMPSGLNRLLQFMDSCPQAVAAGGRVLNSDGSLQFSCRRFPNYLTAIFNRRSLLTRIFKNNKFSKNYLMSDWPHNEACEVDWVSACYLIMRRETIEKVGLFDERFFMFCEDVDWCYCAKLKGHKVYYCPEAEIIHLSGNSQKQDLRKIIWHHQSMYKFYKKHYSKFLIMDVLVATALTIRAIFVLIIGYLRYL